MDNWKVTWGWRHDWHSSLALLSHSAAVRSPVANYHLTRLTGYTGTIPDSKVYGANMGPTWGRQDPGGAHVGPMKLAIWEEFDIIHISNTWLKYGTCINATARGTIMGISFYCIFQLPLFWSGTLHPQCHSSPRATWTLDIILVYGIFSGGFLLMFLFHCEQLQYWADRMNVYVHTIW